MAGESDTAHGQLVAAIRALSERRAAHIRTRSVEEMVDDFYADDARLLAPGRPEVRGRAALREFWQGEFEAGLVALTMELIEIDGEGGFAYEIGAYDIMIRRSARAPHQDHGKYLTVFRRQRDGSWKAIADTFNSDHRRT